MLDHLNKSITKERINSTSNKIVIQHDDVVFQWQNFVKKAIDSQSFNVVSENDKEIQGMLDFLFKSHSFLIKKYTYEASVEVLDQGGVD